MEVPHMDDMKRQSIELACENVIKEVAAFNDFGEIRKMADLFTSDATSARPLHSEHPVVGQEAIYEVAYGLHRAGCRRSGRSNGCIPMHMNQSSGRGAA